MMDEAGEDFFEQLEQLERRANVTPVRPEARRRMRRGTDRIATAAAAVMIASTLGASDRVTLELAPEVPPPAASRVFGTAAHAAAAPAESWPGAIAAFPVLRPSDMAPSYLSWQDAPAAVSEADIAWGRYLSRLEAPVGRFATTQVAALRTVWDRFRSITSKLGPPQTAPTEDDALSMVWNAGPHHLEVEVDVRGKVGWFYTHRETGKYESGTGSRATHLPRRLEEHVKSFA